MVKKTFKENLVGSTKFFFVSFFTFCLGHPIIGKVTAIEQQVWQIQSAIAYVAVTFIAMLSLFWIAKLIYQILPDNSYINHFMFVLVGTAIGLLGISIFTLVGSFILF